jgi:hypothetical protein
MIIREKRSPKRKLIISDKMIIKRLKKIIIIQSLFIGYLFMRLCNSKNYQSFL